MINTEKRRPGFSVKLDKPAHQLSQEEINWIHSLVEQHGVICIKNQNLGVQEIFEFTQQFGEPIKLPESYTFWNIENYYVTRIGNVLKDGTVRPNVKTSLYWHSDGDIVDWPNHFIYLCMNAKEIPPVGGSTSFLDMRKIYNDSNQEKREWLAGAKIITKLADIEDFEGSQEALVAPDIIHDVTQYHPMLGRPNFWLGSNLGKVVLRDGTRTTSGDVMKELYHDKYVYEHNYEVGDLILWDDIQLHHKSTGGFGDLRRLLFRCHCNVSKGKSLDLARNYIRKILKK